MCALLLHPLAPVLYTKLQAGESPLSPMLHGDSSRASEAGDAKRQTLYRSNCRGRESLEREILTGMDL